MATYIAVFAMVLAYVALVAAYLALRTLAKVRRTTVMLARTGRSDEPSSLEEIDELTAAMERQSERSAVLVDQLADLQAYVDSNVPKPTDTDGAGALRNVALVRYDAFADMSGRMSFSLALLDSSADGIVISAIAATSDTRVYAKGIARGKGEHDLSPEEQQAVKAAMTEKRSGLLGRKAS